MPLESMYPTPARFKRIFFLPSSSIRRTAVRKATLPSPMVIFPLMSRTVTSPACRSEIFSSAILELSFWDFEFLIFGFERLTKHRKSKFKKLKSLYHSYRGAAFGTDHPIDLIHECAHKKDA